MNIIARKVGVVLRRRRRALEMSQVEAARRAGITNETLNRLECSRGKGGKPSTWLAIAAVYGMSADTLLVRAAQVVLEEEA